jgi:hypothetical protein
MRCAVTRSGSYESAQHARSCPCLLHQGHAKKVAAYEAAKLASEFDPQNRDENVDYYVAKLDELVKNSAG